MTVAKIDEDLDHTKAPLIEHLIELRRRLIYCMFALFFFFVFCYFFRQDIYNFLLVPYKLAVGDRKIDMIYTAPQEFFFTQVKVSFLGALALSSPVIAFQLYMFVAPGLYKNERSAFLPYLFATPILFIMGGALVFLVVMPLALQFFLSMQQLGEGQVQIQLTPRVSEYLNFITTLITGFGLCFQLPVVLTLLARAGIVSSDWLRKQWRYAIVLIFALAALLTPPDLFSQVSLAIPTLLLYELSIYSVKLEERQRAAAEKARAAEEDKS